MARLFLASIAVSLLALQWESCVEASHFRYGSIQWAPVNSYSDTIRFTFRLAFRRSYSSSYNCDQNIISSGNLIGSGDSWRATCDNPGCRSISIADTGFHCTDFSSLEDWSTGENSFTYTFDPAIDDEWLVSYTSCCWISLSRYGNGNWLVSASVHLNRRSDNGRLNSSPVSRSPAIVRWQDGCPQSFRIPVEDPDGDALKCRWATVSESSIQADSFPYGTLDEETCVLTNNGSSGTAGTYVVALTIEDFPAGTTDFSSVSPFSAVGLQFLVIISGNNGPCGDVPEFTASTPNDGECSEVQIGSPYIAVIEVKLEDFSKHIAEIVTTSPIGMQLTSLRYHGGVYYRNATWYPAQYQVGQQLFCFKAVDSRGVESESRCVTILVGLSNTPHVIAGSQTPIRPISRSGPGFLWWSIQFDQVIKMPRSSSYIRLVLLPSGHTVHKVDTLSPYVRINSDHTTLQFAMPYAALSMNGSYAILIDHGAVVGRGCSYDGPPTPGITSTNNWNFGVDGVCPFGHYLEPPGFTNCVDINECGSHSRSKRSYSWWNYTASVSAQPNTYAITPTTTSTSLPFTASSGSYFRYIYAHYYSSYIYSPGYPSCYPNNEICTWLIEAPVGFYVYLHIDDFNLEHGGSHCPWDYLEIHDGNTLSSPLITKACGSLAYMHIYSSGRFLFMRFVSDGVIQMPGFSALCHYTSYRHSNYIPTSMSLSSSANSVFCTPSYTQSMWISATSANYPTSSSTGITPTPGFKCPFDQDLCGFTQLTNDNFDWTHQSGGTLSSSTGPTSDHSGQGRYVYIETSSPRVQGDNAQLVKSGLSFSTKKCLTFYYHMYGVSMGALNVYVGSIQVWSESGNQGNNWHKASVEITQPGASTLVFEGIRGSSYTGDAAIDDVELSECANYTTSSSTGITPTPVITSAASASSSQSECSHHTYLEDSVRGQGFYNGYYGHYQCDNNLPFGWYRFRGAAGTQMPTSCVGENRCSSHAPGWLNSTHPSVADGIANARVCFHWVSDCCHWSTDIRVRNCSGFYVYELGPPPACWLRYCGDGGANFSTSSSTGIAPTPAITTTASASSSLAIHAITPTTTSTPFPFTASSAITPTTSSSYVPFSVSYPDSPQFLLFADATNGNIMKVSPDYPGSLISLSLSSIISRPVAIDYDVVEDRVYWTDVVMKTISRSFLNGSMQEVIFYINVDMPEGLAVDIIGRNLYWTDTGTNKLEVSKLDGSYRTVLIASGLDEPRDIILDVTNRIMYWTDWGSHPKVEKADMCGNRRVVLVNSGLHWPNGLTRDHRKNRLYWVDASLGKLEYLDLNNNNRVTLIDSSAILPHPFGLTLLGDYLYWTDWTRQAVYRAQKDSGGNVTAFITNIGQPMDIHGYNLRYSDYIPTNMSLSSSANSVFCTPSYTQATWISTTSAITSTTTSTSLPFTASSAITPTTSSSYAPFSVSYPGSCSRHIYAPYYIDISSPGYPSCYPNNKICTWLIEAPVGYYVYLEIHDFNLEHGGSHCPWDYLEIHDGNTLSSPLITKACGSLAYMFICSSGRFLFMRFVSDSIIQMPGFWANCHYTSYRYSNYIPTSMSLSSSANSVFCTPSYTQATWISATSAITPTTSSSYVPFSVSYPGSCSRHIYAQLVTYFNSPGYPSCYPNNKMCTWLIEAPVGHHVYLEMYNINLEYGGSHCPWDYLEIHDGNTLSSPLITKVCGYLAYMYIYSSGRFLFMRFVSDNVIQMPGFSAWCHYTNQRYSNYIPTHTSMGLSSSANYVFCTPSYTQSTWISATSASQINPTPSSSRHYAPSSSYVLPTPVDFQLHLPADCAQICTNTPGSYSCSCVSGYQLASDGKSCTDIDECSTNNGGCSHHCYNIPGSFYCGCPEGTTMSNNNLTCVEPGVDVTCGENNMTVSLEKQTFPFFDVSKLHLRYSSCRATQNTTHFLISTPLNGCGTLVNETEEALIFWNEIQADVVIIDYVITRTHNIKLPFYCSYSRRQMLSLSFLPRNIFFGQEAGYGNFTIRMDFYKSAAFTTPYADNEYPIDVSLNEYLHMKFSVESSAKLVIMAVTCKATKDASYYSWPEYTIIYNGCPRDTTLDYSYDPTKNSQQINIRAFRFFDDYDRVYFHCQLLVCHRYSPNSRCSNSCLNNKRRKRRDVTRDELEHEESTTKKILTSGPIKITKKRTSGDTGQSKQAALIGGAAAAGGFGLIAVIALVVIFVKYRIARRFMNRNKVGDLYTTKEEQMSRKNAYVQEDDMIEKEDSF